MCCDTSSLGGCQCSTSTVTAQQILPEIEVVDRALLVAHVNVKGEEIDWSQRSSTEHFHQCWQTVALLQFPLRHMVVHGDDFDCEQSSGW